MPINITGQTRRWLDLGSVVHILYETEDGHHVTVCRKIVRSGAIVHGTTRQIKGRKCRECMLKISKRWMREE